LNRREFITGASIAAPLFVPRSAWGANDRLTFGAIGVGNRGRWLKNTFQKLGARCVALCDVYQPYLETARSTSPDARTYEDYREMLAAKGMDFVMIATPDHHHCPMLRDALNSGLDVYLEKPLSLTLEESVLMVEAGRKSKQIVQVGMQRRSMSFIRNAREFIREGGLGRISMVEAFWNWHFQLPLDDSPLPGKLNWDLFLGSAPKRPLEPKRFRWWRGFWDYSGGNMTDQGTHLMDVVQWMTDSGPPLSATCQGMVVEANGAEVPNVFSAAFEYPNFIATWTLNYRSAYEHDWWITFRGEKGTMVMNRRGYRLYENPGASPTPWSQNVKEAPVREVPDKDGPEPHLQNFLDCVKSRQTPNCTLAIAAQAVAGPHMANLAYRQGRKVRAQDLGRIS